MESKTIDLGGPVHYADFGGDGPSMVLVHGLGGSCLNWYAVAPALAEHARIWAVDLAGFGRTAPDGRRADVRANRALLDRFVDAKAGGRAILVGNSMGGMISLMQAALRPGGVDGLVLVDPAMPHANGARPDPLVVAAFAAYAIPGVGERFIARRARKLGPEGLVRETMRLCNADASRIAPEIVEAHIALARERASLPWPSAAFLQAARSLIGVAASRRRYLEMVSAVRSPTLLVHGARDRLVPLAAARAVAQRRPDWTFEIIDDAGHTPQLETPGRFVATVTRWMRDAGLVDAPAGDAASPI